MGTTFKVIPAYCGSSPSCKNAEINSMANRSTKTKEILGKRKGQHLYGSYMKMRHSPLHLVKEVSMAKTQGETPRCERSIIEEVSHSDLANARTATLILCSAPVPERSPND